MTWYKPRSSDDKMKWARIAFALWLVLLIAVTALMPRGPLYAPVVIGYLVVTIGTPLLWTIRHPISSKK